MPKQSRSILLTAYVALAILTALGIAAVEAWVLPFLYGKSLFLNNLQHHLPFIIDTIVVLLGIAIGALSISRVAEIERFVQLRLRRESKLSKVIATADLAAETGIAFIDSDGFILSATTFMEELADKSRANSIVGKHFSESYSDNLSRVIGDLLQKAIASKSVATVEILDWSIYCERPVGSAILYVAPSFTASGYKGAIIVVRSTADVRNAEDTLINYQMHYQILFDALPTGVAVFRPSIAADGGADGYMITANPALKKTLEGLPLPMNEPCSVAWPSFIQQDKLREAIGQASESDAPVRCEFFSPALGKHLEVLLAPLPGARLLAMVTDQTEPRMNERKVLELNDQLQRTLAAQSAHMGDVLEDIQHFNQATADMVEMRLEHLRNVIPRLAAEDAEVLTEVSCGLYKVLNQMLRYHNVANMPFNDTTLLFPAEVVTRLLEPLGNRFPNVSFSVGSLPGVVANREILTDILEQLIVSLAQLPVIGDAGRIEISSERDFLSTSITVTGFGFDSSSIFFETPDERGPLDWTLTSDLDLATARRMVDKHGGDLSIGPSEDGLGVVLSFSIGSPPV